MASYLYGYTLLISISLSIAVQLDGDCTSSPQCTVPNSICQNGKCKCNSPSYIPCNSACKANEGYAYEGESCLTNENCRPNTVCTANKCRCVPDFTAQNGLCFKDLNAICTNGNECWSQYCTNSKCACPPSYTAASDKKSCVRKLVKIYNNWDEANAKQDWCLDDNSCIDTQATCVAGPTGTTTKYCKCPNGYKIQANNEKCEITSTQLLSPLDTAVAKYDECGLCADSNAVCIQAADETTCWCQLGYIKKNNKCEPKAEKPLLILPNSNDREQHSFTSNCNQGGMNNTEIQNGLCVCATGYELSPDGRSCTLIKRSWINDIYEYGLCTRITSNNEAIGVDGVCPKPLKCEPRRDKHVCSCGKGKFQDLDDPNKCVFFIDEKTNSVQGQCPGKNAIYDNAADTCKCSPGYKVVDSRRRCELLLSNSFDQASCDSSLSNSTVCKNFGEKAVLCLTGECRCSGNQSFPDTNQTRCFAPVEEILSGPMEKCPPNSILTGNRCACNASYRPSSNRRECIRMNVQLVQFQSSSPPATNLTAADCGALFSGPVLPYLDNSCQCRFDARPNDNNTGCLFRLNATLGGSDNPNYCPLNSGIQGPGKCECDLGYNPQDDKCVPMAVQVYEDGDSTAQNVSGLTTPICKKLFGFGSSISTAGRYCICANTSYAINSNTFCNILIDEPVSENIDQTDCPLFSEVTPVDAKRVCKCQPGYYASLDRRSCETSKLPLIGAAEDKNQSAVENCGNRTDADCISKYGQDAFCQDFKCYCNRLTSFVNASDQCESFSRYIYPNEHEYHDYACSQDSDCASKPNTVCAYVDAKSQFKLCTCKSGSLLDPDSKTCSESRCTDTCQTNQNFVCKGYQCVCKDGYHKVDDRCEKSPDKLELYQTCNVSEHWAYAIANTAEVKCDEQCNSARCAPGYRPDSSKCVKYQLENDKCVGTGPPDICQTIDENAVCDRDENKCVCTPSFYLSNNKCARQVNSPCQKDKDCGDQMVCEKQKCKCGPGQCVQRTKDKYGREVLSCLTGGIDRIRSNTILVAIFIIVGLFTKCNFLY